MEGIRAASVYAEADFRINQSAYRNIDRFEKKIDKLKKKLDSLSSPNISVGGRVGGGGSRISSGGGRQGEGWYWNTIGKVAYNMRKREAMVQSALTGMQNTYRTLKLPTSEMERLTGEVAKYGEKLKSGEMISAEFAEKIKKVKAEARDLHKQLNVPAPKYTKDLNKGSINQIVAIAKAKSKQEMLIHRARLAFERSAGELNIKPGSNSWFKHHNALKNIIAEYQNAPHAVNKFKQSITSLDATMRHTGKQGLAGMAAQLRSIKGNLIVMAAVLAGAMSFGAAKTGKEFARMQMMMETAFGDKAKKEISFVRQEADRLGVSVLDAAKSWTKLGFSAKVGGFDIEETRALFKAMMGFSQAMGLSSEQMALSFHAIVQAYAKGALTAEELNTQLADHIPGIIAMMKDALGFKGDGEGFAKALKNKEFTPDKFAKAMTDVFNKQAGGFMKSAMFEYIQKEGEFVNALKYLADTFFKGMAPGLILTFDNLIAIIRMSLPVWKLIGTVIGDLLGFFTFLPRLIMAAIHDMYYYIKGDENVRKEINDFLGWSSGDKVSQSAGKQSNPMATAAWAVFGGGAFNSFWRNLVSESVKGALEIKILPSEEFKVKMDKGNSAWPAFSVATPE